MSTGAGEFPKTILGWVKLPAYLCPIPIIALKANEVGVKLPCVTGIHWMKQSDDWSDISELDKNRASLSRHSREVFESGTDI